MTKYTASNEQAKSLNELQAYWTEERRAAAKPKPMPVLEELPVAPFEPSGELVTAPPNIPDDGQRESADGQPDEPAEGLASTCPANKVTNPTTWPNSCNGKLFFNWKGGPYVGSAGSITLEVLLTAGHNVYDEGEWSTDFLYYPAYPDLGKSWGWARAAVFTAWQNNSDYKFDYAMILTSSSMAPVGSWGWAYNLAPSSWKAFGYPGNSPYSGDQMYETTGSSTGSGNPMGMNNNDMHSGSSGGNWIATYDGKQEYANGVNSYHTSQECVEFSPYFDSNFATLLECVTTGNCQ